MIRALFQRIIRDQRVLRSNPVCLDNRIHQLAINQLRSQTKDLRGEEKFEKMHELACATYDGLCEAVDELEKDLELNPKKFLGIALDPTQLLSALSFTATVAFTIFQ